MKRKILFGIFITLSLALLVFNVICCMHLDDGIVWIVLECLSLMLYDVSNLCIFGIYMRGE